MPGRLSYRFGLVGVVLTLTACSPSTPPSLKPADNESLGDQLAVVAGESITRQLVIQLARHRGLSASRALDALVSDALFASELKRQSPGLGGYLRSVALARSMSEEFVRQARAGGPPTDDEVSALTERRWWIFDRPVTSRTTHVVVLAKEGDDPKARRKLAQRLFEKLKEASTAEDFRELAQGEDTGGLEIKVEDLAPVAPDGRAIDLANPPPPGVRVPRYALTYATAANAIPKVGQLALAGSTYGDHVMMLTERIPARHVPFEERRSMMHDEIVQARAQELEQTALAESEAKAKVQVERNAMTITEQVRVR